MAFAYLKKQLKNLCCRENIKDLHGFDYTVNELVNMYRQNELLAREVGSILDESILKYKKSDTIFLLGSGPSINNLGRTEFSEIKKHDSIGFNFWFAHEFVPSFYMMQLPKNKPEIMLNIFYDRAEEYQKVPFIIRGSALSAGAFDFNDRRLTKLKDKKVYMLNEYPISSKCRINIDTLIEYMSVLGFLEFGKISSFVPKWRGTLGLLVSLAYQMGYKNIVLCGMDMCDAKHFWDNPAYRSKKIKYMLPEDNNLQLMTNNMYSPNTVPAYIYKLRDWMWENAGVNFFVADPDTVLYPEIPVYDFC